MICHAQVCCNDAELKPTCTLSDGKVRFHDKLFPGANTDMVNTLQAPVQQVCYIFLSRHSLSVFATLNSGFLHFFAFALLQCNGNHGIFKQRLL